MKQLDRTAVLVVCLILAITGGTARATRAGATGQPSQKGFPTGFYGVDYTIHSFVDQNFCVQDTPSQGGTRHTGEHVPVCPD
jgi:hypothetical protein